MYYCKNILVCGGDKRQKYMYRQMLADGLNVKSYAIGEENSVSADDIKDFDVIIFPVPVSRDGINLNAPMVDYGINLGDILNRIGKNRIVLGGMCDRIDFDMIDYFKDEKLQMYNAIPTAEGALRIAMENTERTLYGSRCLVLGYGRIGKVLSERLADMGAEVTVCTRNEKDVALAEVMGHKAVKLDYISGCLQGSEIIFNTIPKTVVTGDMLGEISKSALIIDLASKPYGIDMTAAEVLGRKVIVASGLPGKFTPESSGAILKDVIMKILIEMEV